MFCLLLNSKQGWITLSQVLADKTKSAANQLSFPSFLQHNFQ